MMFKTNHQVGCLEKFVTLKLFLFKQATTGSSFVCSLFVDEFLSLKPKLCHFELEHIFHPQIMSFLSFFLFYSLLSDFPIKDNFMLSRSNCHGFFLTRSVLFSYQCFFCCFLLQPFPLLGT